MNNSLDTAPSTTLHPPVSASPRAFWTAIGGLAMSVAALGATMVYQQRPIDAAPMAARQPVVAPAVVPKQEMAVTPAKAARKAIDPVAGRRVPAPPVAFAVEPVRAPATARPAPRG